MNGRKREKKEANNLMADSAHLAIPQFMGGFSLRYAFVTKITRVGKLCFRNFFQQSSLFAGDFFHALIEFIPGGTLNIDFPVLF